MLQCPDCDSIKIFSAEPEGDGKCSACHGSGYGGFLEVSFDAGNGQTLECEECLGTGKCQGCGGMGLVEEYQPSLAA